MDSDFSPGEASGSGSAELDFGFAFNDRDFSDRVLRIEIMPDLPGTKTAGDSCSSIADWARNRRDGGKISRKTMVYVVVQSEAQILNFDMSDTANGVTYENQDEEAVAMVEESPSDVGLNSSLIGNDTTHSNDSSWNMDCSTDLKVKTRHVSSPILAAKSPYFYKLFSNGMRESEQCHVTLRIHASEETALMDMLSFMYSNSLSTTIPTALLDVLMAADEYRVASSSLTDAGKQFLAERYKNVTKFQEGLANLPLAGIEAVFSSDDLQKAEKSFNLQRLRSRACIQDRA